MIQSVCLIHFFRFQTSRGQVLLVKDLLHWAASRHICEKKKLIRPPANLYCSQPMCNPEAAHWAVSQPLCNLEAAHWSASQPICNLKAAHLAASQRICIIWRTPIEDWAAAKIGLTAFFPPSQLKCQKQSIYMLFSKQLSSQSYIELIFALYLIYVLNLEISNF